MTRVGEVAARSVNCTGSGWVPLLFLTIFTKKENNVMSFEF